MGIISCDNHWRWWQHVQPTLWGSAGDHEASIWCSPGCNYPEMMPTHQQGNLWWAGCWLCQVLFVAAALRIQAGPWAVRNKIQYSEGGRMKRALCRWVAVIKRMHANKEQRGSKAIEGDSQPSLTTHKKVSWHGAWADHVCLTCRKDKIVLHIQNSIVTTMSLTMTATEGIRAQISHRSTSGQIQYGILTSSLLVSVVWGMCVTFHHCIASAVLARDCTLPASRPTTFT